MIKISGLTVPLSYTNELLLSMCAEKLKISKEHITGLNITRRATSKKNKDNVHFNMDITVSVDIDEDTIAALKYKDDVSKEMNFTYLLPRRKKLEKRPIVVGCGPCGMFAALILAEAGVCPILLERGVDVDSRKKMVNDFWLKGTLDKNTNVQFGEGGAGTFSDGKLKTGAKDFRKMKVLCEYVAAGAPEEILYLDMPHIGTDNLSKIVKNIRKKIIALGGEVKFGATVTEILQTDGKVRGVRFIKDGKEDELLSDNVILAIGHSARDTYKNLLSQGVKIEQKPIAIGMRIEHPQSLIDKIEYGKFAGNKALGAASYRLVVHLEGGRSVYSFCMCPGGKVVASASEENSIVTNGMSEFARDGRNANTALLVTLNKDDLKSDDPLAGVYFQRKVERAAFSAAGGSYKAPATRLEDFNLKRRTVAFGDVEPTYMPGTEFVLPDDYLPSFITDSLRASIKDMDDWMPGYNFPDAVLTGVETRSSSPVRMPRGESFESVGIAGLYPAGEGAGYSGGIISSAVDGVICAEKILNKQRQ